MNVALIGSVSSSWYALDGLLRGGVEVTGVLAVDESQADRICDYRSLRTLAANGRIPFQSFVKVSEPQVEAFLLGHAPDLLWAIGLSQLVPQRLRDVARFGGVGFHPTMLPLGRGRAPVAWTILLKARAAVSLFFMTDEPDAGDIIVQRDVPVLPDDYAQELIQRTNEVLAEVILELAPRIRAGDLPRTPQDHSKASYYPKRTPEDGRVDWSRSTDHVYRLIRAAGRPYPGAFTNVGSRKLTVWRGRPAQKGTKPDRPEPGRVLRIDRGDGVLVATSDGGIWMTDVEVDLGGQVDEVVEVGTRLA